MFTLFIMNRIILILPFLIFTFVNCDIERDELHRAYDLIDRYVVQLNEQHNTPGMVLIVTDPENIMHTSAYGYEDVKTRSPVSASTIFQIGSISKSFTSIALLQLYEEGIIDVDAPLTEYLPWFSIRTDYDPITARHLAAHTAGIPRDRDDIPPSWYSAYALRERITAAPPGERYSYSNIGYQTLGVLLESVLEKKYSRIIQTSILEPLGMDDTAPVIINDIRPRLAAGYTYLYDDRPSHPDHPLVEAAFFEYTAADGSIASTAEDMAKYMRMILNRGNAPGSEILTTGGFNAFTGHEIRLDEEGKEFYGYGVRISEREDGRTIISHGGGMVGYRAMMIVDITKGIGVFAAVNGPGDPGSAAQFALDAVYAASAGNELPSLPDVRGLSVIDNANEYEGTFVSPGGEEIRFEAVNSSLYLIRNDLKVQLEHRGGDRFYANHPGFNVYFFTFTRDDNGVREVSYGPEWYTGDEYDGPITFEYPDRWNFYPGHYRTQNPWTNNFRIFLRKGELYIVHPSGFEILLSEIEPDLFGIGDEPTAERLRFDTVIDGKTLRANYSGVYFYRVLK